MLRKIFLSLHRPVVRLLLRTVPIRDPWQRFPHAVPLHRYGMGAQRDFRWYFEGGSLVAVRSVEEMQAWLLTCQYVRDPDLFDAPDVWQHPRTFEHLRMGDCEDFALWTWRKLIELEYEAELMVGQWMCGGGPPESHAWVIFRQDRKAYVFDPVVCDRARMIRPLDAVHHEYIPELSVDSGLNRYAYGGYYQQLRRRGRPRRPVPAPVVLLEPEHIQSSGLY